MCQLHLGVNQPCAIYSFEDIAYEITNSRKNRKNQFFGLGGVFIGSRGEMDGTELCYIIPFTRSTRFKFDLLTLVYYHTTLLKEVMPTFVLKTLYHAHVTSIVTYCNIIWANTYDTHTKPVLLMLKRIIRNIARADYFAHTQPIYNNLQILNFEGIRKLSLAKHFIIHNTTFAHLLPNHDYRTRNRHRLRLPDRNGTLYERSYLYQAPAFWTKFSSTLTDQELTSLSTKALTNKVKRYLLSQP